MGLGLRLAPVAGASSSSRFLLPDGFGLGFKFLFPLAALRFAFCGCGPRSLKQLIIARFGNEFASSITVKRPPFTAACLDDLFLRRADSTGHEFILDARSQRLEPHAQPCHHACSHCAQLERSHYPRVVHSFFAPPHNVPLFR